MNTPNGDGTRRLSRRRALLAAGSALSMAGCLGGAIDETDSDGSGDATTGVTTVAGANTTARQTDEPATTSEKSSAGTTFSGANAIPAFVHREAADASSEENPYLACEYVHFDRASGRPDAFDANPPRSDAFDAEFTDAMTQLNTGLVADDLTAALNVSFAKTLVLFGEFSARQVAETMDGTTTSGGYPLEIRDRVGGFYIVGGPDENTASFGVGPGVFVLATGGADAAATTVSAAANVPMGSRLSDAHEQLASLATIEHRPAFSVWVVRTAEASDPLENASFRVDSSFEGVPDGSAQRTITLAFRSEAEVTELLAEEGEAGLAGAVGFDEVRDLETERRGNLFVASGVGAEPTGIDYS